MVQELQAQNVKLAFTEIFQGILFYCFGASYNKINPCY